jgi:hypothetical protein
VGFTRQIGSFALIGRDLTEMIDNQRFHISLESPQCGWMALSVTGGEGFVRYGASYTPYDSLGDLLDSVTALLQGQDSIIVKWETEPEQYDWHFQREGEQITLRIIYYPDHRRTRELAREVFVYSLPLIELARDIEAEVRELQERAERDVFESNWRREFPTAELAQLSAALEGK